jgi:cell division protein FtsB
MWILFFDSNSYLNQRRLNAALTKVESEKEFYISEIEKDKKTSESLKSNTDLLERFAREQFLMKRDNEDVYLIVEEEK